MSTRIIIGDARTRLAEMPAESVHCVVTSPPYWGLRDYGTAQWDGGDPACDHIQQPYKAKTPKVAPNGGYIAQVELGYRHICGKCGARRIDSQIGLEPNYREYVATLVAVFREVRRVLRADGTVWLNLGDCYAGYWGGNYAHKPFGQDRTPDNSTPPHKPSPNFTSCGFKPKDLVGIPWRVAFALQDDGWYLRQDIIWAKPNPMPESVADRCTKAHEYVFLLSKSARYWFDADAISEPSAYPGDERHLRTDRTTEFARPDNGSRMRTGNPVADRRNKRSVWTVATAPYSEAHFATFPPALIEPCILAGCPRNGTVLDPFLGAGTTGLVADRLGRNCIGIELNRAYAAMAQRRIDDDAGMFADTWCEAAQ